MVVFVFFFILGLGFDVCFDLKDFYCYLKKFFVFGF